MLRLPLAHPPRVLQQRPGHARLHLLASHSSLGAHPMRKSLGFAACCSIVDRQLAIKVSDLAVRVLVARGLGCGRWCGPPKTNVEGNWDVAQGTHERSRFRNGPTGNRQGAVSRGQQGRRHGPDWHGQGRDRLRWFVSALINGNGNDPAYQMQRLSCITTIKVLNLRLCPFPQRCRGLTHAHVPPVLPYNLIRKHESRWEIWR